MSKLQPALQVRRTPAWKHASSPVSAHIQAHQPSHGRVASGAPYARLKTIVRPSHPGPPTHQVRLLGARPYFLSPLVSTAQKIVVRCVTGPPGNASSVCPSHPGTPTLSFLLHHSSGAWLARLERGATTRPGAPTPPPPTSIPPTSRPGEEPPISRGIDLIEENMRLAGRVFHGMSRCASAPPGHAPPTPASAHVQTHQPPLVNCMCRCASVAPPWIHPSPLYPVHHLTSRPPNPPRPAGAPPLPRLETPLIDSPLRANRPPHEQPATQSFFQQARQPAAVLLRPRPRLHVQLLPAPPQPGHVQARLGGAVLPLPPAPCPLPRQHRLQE